MKRLLFYLILVIHSINLNAQTDTSKYSFFVAGHTYSWGGLHKAFIKKFDYIKSRPEIQFGVFTGDIVAANPDTADWDNVDRDLDSLGLPVYFAVGNHDMENRPLYESRYGDTYYSFVYRNDLFIVLDPNIDGWNISGDQLVFLKNVTDSLSKTVDNIFVFFHQLLWRESDNRYADILPNSFAGRADSINFWTEIEPLFNKLSNPVFMFSGDVGAASWSSDFMYDSYDNISLVASGMGENDGDNIVVINVDTNKSVSYDLICLNDSILECFGELTDYKISSRLSERSDPNFISIIPNPASTYTRVKIKKKRNLDLQFYNVNGGLIMEKFVHHDDQQINLESFTPGVYLVKVTEKRKVSTIKLIIQR